MGFAKKFVSTIGAGVVGSALTLGVVANTDLLQQDASAQTSNVLSSSQSGQSASNILQTSASTPLSLSDMVESASKGIVGITNFQSAGNRFAGQSETREYGTGSGVVFKKDEASAYIVTNNHVIEGASKLEVTMADGQKADAELVGSDALTDLAVIKIDKKYADTVLEFGNSDQVRAGDSVVAIGNPLGLDFSGTVTQGIISSPARSIDVKTSAGTWKMDVIQTDAAINPGNSGGGLFNAEGQVIGINSLKIAESGVEGLGFAIPSNDVLPLVDQIMKSGKIERPYMGVGLADLANVPYMYVQNLPEEVKGGVMVTSVDPNSAAAKAGMKEQDVITAINGKEITNSMDLRKVLYSDLKIGDKATLTIYRDNQKQNVELTLTSNSDMK